MRKDIGLSDADRAILSRWPEVRDTAADFQALIKRMRKLFVQVVDDLEPAINARGYEVWAEEPWAEVKAYRPDWCLEGEEDPFVVALVGGLFPVGYYKVEVPNAYRALYIQGIEKLDETDLDTRFSNSLLGDLGGVPEGWESRVSDEEWYSPLWAAIPLAGDHERAELAGDKERLKQIVMRELEFFFPFGDAVARAVKRLGP